jgi:hypothetical protein
LDYLPIDPNKEPPKKTTQINEKKKITTEIGTSTKENELALRVSFKLLPSKMTFSKVQLDFWFDNQKISSVSVRIPQSPLSRDEFELTPVLDMRGIPAGFHVIKVEMFELWSSGERLTQAVKEVNIDYVPQTRESRFVKIPTVKTSQGLF